MRFIAPCVLGFLAGIVYLQTLTEAEANAQEKAQENTPPIAGHLAYSVEPADLSVEELKDLLRKKMGSITAIQFKKVSRGQVLEELYYESPGKFKAIVPDSVTIVREGLSYDIDANTREIVRESKLSLESVDYLRSVRLESLNQVDADYRLEAFKVLRVPDVLRPLYADTPADRLYLLAGYLRDPHGGPWPPRPRVDLFIDASLGLIVAQRDYWIRGIAVSVEDVELAQDIVIIEVRKVGPGIILPARGRTQGYVRELSNVNQDWTIEIVKLNQDIPDEEFGLEAFKRSEDLDLDPMERWKKEFERLNP